MEEIKKKLSELSKFKYPLLVLVVGILILLFPTRTFSGESEPEGGTGLAQLLSCTEGVGEAKVILSDSGVVVVCHGANNAKIRYDIIQAVQSYTGFGSDRITVLKMVD